MGDSDSHSNQSPDPTSELAAAWRLRAELAHLSEEIGRAIQKHPDESGRFGGCEEALGRVKDRLEAHLKFLEEDRANGAD